MQAVGKQESPLLTLETNSTEATAGYYRLAWRWNGDESSESQDFILQESASDDFSTSSIHYQGPDLATVVSGQTDGVRYYRVRPSGSSSADWSNVVQVETQHHPLSRAIKFFAVGAVVFVATLIVILRGKPPEHSQ